MAPASPHNAPLTRECQHRHLAHPDTGVASGIPAGTDGADAVADRRPPEEDPRRDRHDDGDDHAEVHPGLVDEDRQVGVGRESLGLRDPSSRILLRIDQRSTQEIGDELHRDDVEHDRREDLVDPEVRLERPGDGPPYAAADHPGSQHERQEDRRRQITEAERGDRREQRTEKDLTLATDVDHPCPEGDADPRSDEEQGRRLDRRVSELGATAERPREQRLVALPRRRPEQPDHHGADGEGTEGGDDRNRCAAQPLHEMTVGCPRH